MNEKSKKLPIILSLVWFLGGTVSSFGLYGTDGLIYLGIVFLTTLLYWVITLKFGVGSVSNFMENSKIYAPFLEVTNLILGIKNLKKEISLSNTTFKYRLLYIVGVVFLILSYFLADDLVLVEKLAIILIYSPFIFLGFNGKKTAYIVFFILISMDILANLISGGPIIHNVMKWFFLSLITLNTYTVENMKK
ncbi:MAG: hypothetical protein ACK5N8_08505 [Alphaproteobacteria bacterium]